MKQHKTLAREKKDSPKRLTEHSLTIKVGWNYDWYSAVCLELKVSGFGATIQEALEAVGRSIESTIMSKSNNQIKSSKGANRVKNKPRSRILHTCLTCIRQTCDRQPEDRDPENCKDWKSSASF